MMLLTETEFEVVGKIRLGPLSASTSERLARLGGEWLEFSPEEGALVVRHVQPGGSPALAAVPAELITILESLPAAERETLPGGALVVRDRSGILLRLVVEGGEIRIQWPREDWSHAIDVPVEDELRSADPFSARVSGHVRFQAPAGAEGFLNEFVEGFEGLYPAGELDLERQGAWVRGQLRAVNVGPRQLLDRLRELAAPPDSLEADLDVGSFLRHAGGRDFRLRVRGGVARALRPALWRESR